MARLIVDVKEEVKAAIEKYAEKQKMTIKDVVLSSIGAIITYGGDTDYLWKKEEKVVASKKNKG